MRIYRLPVVLRQPVYAGVVDSLIIFVHSIVLK